MIVSWGVASGFEPAHEGRRSPWPHSLLVAGGVAPKVPPNFDGDSNKPYTNKVYIGIYV